MAKKKTVSMEKKTASPSPRQSKSVKAKSAKKKSSSKKTKRSENSIFSATNALVLLIVILISAVAYKFVVLDKEQKQITKSGQLEKSTEIKKTLKTETKREEKSVSEAADTERTTAAPKLSGQQAYLKGITTYAKKYIGLPLASGKDPDRDGATDNSHLICAIYKNSARLGAMKFAGYRPMKQLLKNTHKIHLSELRNGDLIVLNNGHAALLYGFDENPDNFYYVYASGKKGRVVNIDSEKLRTYWLKNKKGYFRLNDSMFTGRTAK